MDRRRIFQVPANLHHNWGDKFEGFQDAVKCASGIYNVKIGFPWSIAFHNLNEDGCLGHGRGGYVSFYTDRFYGLSLSPLPPLRGKSVKIVFAKGLPTDFAFDAMGEELYHLQFFSPNLVLNEAYGRLGFHVFAKCRESHLELVVEGEVESLDLGEGTDLAHKRGYELCDRLIEKTGSDFAVVDDLLRYHPLSEIAEVSDMPEQDLRYGLPELKSEFPSASTRELWNNILFHHRFINSSQPEFLLPRTVRRYHLDCAYKRWRDRSCSD